MIDIILLTLIRDFSVCLLLQHSKMRNFRIYFFYAAVTITVLFFNVFAASVTALENSKLTADNVPHIITGSEVLDTEGKYLLTWSINQEEEIVYFEVTAETTGYVGFGISPSGSMIGADIFIGGMSVDKLSTYGKDYHGTGYVKPIEDAHQDWTLTFGMENDTHTKLKFHRLLNTCDEEDFRITDATMRTIWAMGETDTIEYHRSNKGTKSVNLFLQNEDGDFDASKFQAVNFTVETLMPSQHTTYWCTIHELPLFNETQHIVAFEPILENLEAFQHTHHFIFHRCIAPENETAEDFFGKWVDHDGDYCYAHQDASFPFSQYCNGNFIFVWSKGGKRTVFPSTLGLPMPEKLNEREYYAMEIHYDNPDLIEDLSFKTGGRMYYTSELRDQEAGILVVDHLTRTQLTIPPEAADFVVSGHCSSDCTTEYLPEDGITIFNNLLHAHLTGRKLKLRHFRGEEELPWVDSDDYYDFDFQQNKPLSEPRKVLRGDHLTVECTFDTTEVDEQKAVIGGLSSHEEMCQSWFFYFPRQPDLALCGSSQELDEHMYVLGITDYKVKESEYIGASQAFEIVKPDNLAGDYLESVSYNVNWTQEFRDLYQEKKRFGEQISRCGTRRQFTQYPAKYPDNLNVYNPPNDCSEFTEGTNTPSTQSSTGSSSETLPPDASTECEDCSGSRNLISLNIFKILLITSLVNWFYRM